MSQEPREFKVGNAGKVNGHNLKRIAVAELKRA